MVCKWANDSQRLILECFDVISNSPSEIYHYAVPFSPSSSWLHECYSSELLQGVRVVKGLQAGWGTCSRTISLESAPAALACWKNLIATTQRSRIIILDAVTGVSISVLSVQSNKVGCLAFSLNGTFLVSGSNDGIVNLWDMQTGGIVKTFHFDTNWVCCVSISPDLATLASGSSGIIYLWDTQTGRCCHVINGHNLILNSISFSPVDSQLLISASYDGTIKQWNTSGNQTGPTCRGTHVEFSSDGACFASWRKSAAPSLLGLTTDQNTDSGVITIQTTGSGGIITELQAHDNNIGYCCFSPDGKFVAGSIGCTIYLWDLTISDPHPVKTFVGHTSPIIALVFASSLISSSCDGSIKFWPVDAPLVGSVTADSEPTSPDLASIVSIGLQAKDGIALSINKAGVVKSWDLSTGLYGLSSHTKAGFQSKREMWLVDGRLILVWCTPKKIHIWNTGKEEHLQMLDARSNFENASLRISGDGSKVFLLDHKWVKALSTWTGKVIGRVELGGEPSDNPLIVDGSRVWVCFKDSQIKGWDFGIPGSTPTPLSNPPPDPDKPCLTFVDGTKAQKAGLSRIKDTLTRKEVYRLPRRYTKPTAVQWDGQFLVTGYESGKVLILDFIHMFPTQ